MQNHAFLYFKMHRNNKWAHLEKNLSLIRTFIHGHCEVLNMKLNVWLDIRSKDIENFCVIRFVVVGIFSERLTDTSCQDFSFWFLAFLYLWLRLIGKMSHWRVFFFQNWPDICFFFLFWFVPFACYMFLKKKLVHCVLSCWLICVMSTNYMLMLL